MDIKSLTRFTTCVFFCIPFIVTNYVAAEEYKHDTPHKRISVQEDYWVLHASGNFTITPTEQTHPNAGTPLKTVKLVEDNDEDADENKTHTSKLLSDLNVADKILKNIPYGKNLKLIWNVVDGDQDIYFTGLRADRGNLGMSYTTSELPLLGKIEGTEFKISAGNKNEISFKTHIIPFMGELEGLTLKGTTSEKRSKIFARYTVPFD